MDVKSQPLFFNTFRALSETLNSAGRLVYGASCFPR